MLHLLFLTTPTSTGLKRRWSASSQPNLCLRQSHSRQANVYDVCGEVDGEGTSPWGIDRANRCGRAHGTAHQREGIAKAVMHVDDAVERAKHSGRRPLPFGKLGETLRTNCSQRSQRTWTSHAGDIWPRRWTARI